MSDASYVVAQQAASQTPETRKRLEQQQPGRVDVEGLPPGTASGAAGPSRSQVPEDVSPGDAGHLASAKATQHRHRASTPPGADATAAALTAARAAAAAATAAAAAAAAPPPAAASGDDPLDDRPSYGLVSPSYVADVHSLPSRIASADLINPTTSRSSCDGGQVVDPSGLLVLQAQRTADGVRADVAAGRPAHPRAADAAAPPPPPSLSSSPSSLLPPGASAAAAAPAATTVAMAEATATEPAAGFAVAAVGGLAEAASGAEVGSSREEPPSALVAGQAEPVLPFSEASAAPEQVPPEPERPLPKAAEAPKAAPEPSPLSSVDGGKAERQQQLQQLMQGGEQPHHAAAAAAAVNASEPTALVRLGSSAGDTESGSDSDADAPLDDTALAISLLAAAAAAATAAEAGDQHPYPYAPRGDTRRRRTSTWELRSPARRPPRVVAFEGDGGLAELQALINSVVGPTIIDLQGRVVTLAPAPPALPAPAVPAGDGAKQGSRPAAATGAALVPSSALSVPGWSSALEAVLERSRMLEAGVRPPPSQRQRPPPPSQGAASGLPGSGAKAAAGGAAAAAGGGSTASGGLLHLHRDDVTLANGTLQLHRDCRLLVTGRRVTLRRVEVVDAEAAAWWRQATAMPATCLQTSALITVTSPPPSASSGSHHLHRPASQVRQNGSGDGEVSSLELDDCAVIAAGRDRDLLRADGGGAAVSARYSRLRGGANAVVATLQSSLSLDCCVLEGYASAGLVALGSSARVVGSRLLGATGAIVGLQAVGGSNVSALGCFLRGHASNVECLAGSSLDMQGCVLARPDCRYGLTVHPAVGLRASDQPSAPSPATASGATGAVPGPRRLPPPSSPSSPSSTTTAGSAPTAAGGRVRLSDCELAHAVQVGGPGGELELERCTFAMRPAPADMPTPPVQITSDPALAAKLTAAVAATTAAAAAAAAHGGGRGSGHGAGWGWGDQGSAFAGSVAAGGSLRVVGCRVGGGGGGGEGEAVVVEAADEARVHLSSSPRVMVRRLGGGGGGSGSGSGRGSAP